MTGSTHMAAGLAIAVLLPEQTLATTAALVVGSLLPDIDSSTSLVGRYIPILPRLFKHRGITHSPLLAFALLLPVQTRWLACGMLLHILLDLLNPDGIPIFWPNKKRFSVPLVNIKSGGAVDQLIGAIIWCFNIYMYVRMAIGL